MRYPGGCSGTNGQVFDVNADNYWDLVAQYVGDSRWNATNVRAARKWTEDYYGVGDESCHGRGGGINISAIYPEPTAIAIGKAISARFGIPFVNDTICQSTNAVVGPSNVTSTPMAMSARTPTSRLLSLFSPLTVKVVLTVGCVSFSAQALKLTTHVIGSTTYVQCLRYLDSNSETQTVCPNKEIILTMGTIGNARFLQLNGIGNCAQLTALGITCVHNNVNVGQHIFTQTTMDAIILTAPEPRNPMSGLMAHYFSAAAKERNDTLPDTMIATAQILNEGPVAIVIVVMDITRPQDEGSITIQSSDPAHNPLISYNIGLNHPEDITSQAQLLLDVRNILSDVNAAGFFAAETGTTTQYTTLSEIVDAINSGAIGATTNWHHVGSVRMGKATDATAAVNSSGHFAGVVGLRLAGNELMPIGHPGHASASGARDVGAVMVDIIGQEFGLSAHSSW